MSRIPFTVLSRSLRIPLALGAALAAVAMGGSAWAEEPAATTADSTEAAPAATSGPTDDLGVIQVIGATTAGEKLQWVDAAEAAQPDKADLPEISAADWLPSSQD